MPTYEYRCKDCGHELDVTQAFTDDPLTECPSCGGALKKRFGSVGISFKGSGFYKNDSRSTSSSTSKASDTSSADTGSTSSDSGSSSSSTTSSSSSSTSTSSPAATSGSSTATKTSSAS